MSWLGQLAAQAEEAAKEAAKKASELEQSTQEAAQQMDEVAAIGTVVVVGGGVAGMVTALVAAEAGCRVLLLERSARCGGCSFREADSGFATAVSDHAEEATGSPELLALLTENRANDVAWLEKKLGLRLRLLPAALSGHEVPCMRVIDCGSSASDDCGSWAPVGPAVAEALVATLERAVAAPGSQISVLACAHVVRLLTTGGAACAGCVYWRDGEEHEAQGSVVLCTGGYGADFSSGSFLARYRPDLLHLPTARGAHNVGAALRLALPLGAQAAGLEKVDVHPLGLVRADAPDTKSKLAASDLLLRAGGLLVDQDGDRFCAEGTCPLSQIACHMWKRTGPFRLVLNKAAAEEVLCHCSHYIRHGLMRRFPNGVALAREIGVPVLKLEATLDLHYSEVARAAESGGSFDKWLLDRAIPGARVKAEPFYVAIVTPVINGCGGGLAIDRSCAVLSGSIPVGLVEGLFAAGEAARSGGGGASRTRGGAAGDALLECIVQGRQAGRASARLAAILAQDHRAPDPMEPERGAVLAGVGEHDSTRLQNGALSPSMKDVRMRSLLGELTRLLEARLTVGALQASLAQAHSSGGDINAAVEELRARLRPEVAAVASGPAVALSFRDKAHGLPTPVLHSTLPDGGACAELPLTCVHCRLPVTAEVYRGSALADAEAAVDSEEGWHAYATLLYGDKAEYFLGALVIGWSLKSSGSTIDRLLLHTDDVPEHFLRVLQRVWKLRLVQYLEGSSKLYKNYNHSRFKAVFTKLQALSCTDYSKVLMLDLDMLVRRNVDELFRLPTPAALKRSSGKEQPVHGGGFYATDLWRSSADDMCSGINAGVMLLQPDIRIYERMVSEIKDSRHPEHIGTFGPEQDYLSRFYATFLTGTWTHIHARFNYQPMLPDDYVSSAHRKLNLLRDVAIAHYSGPRVKPWKGTADLDEEGVRRLLEDDSVRDSFGRDRGEQSPQRVDAARPTEQKTRVMDGVTIVDDGIGSSSMPQGVQQLMWEWVEALRKCASELREDGVELLDVVREAQQQCSWEEDARLPPAQLPPEPES